MCKQGTKGKSRVICSEFKEFEFETDQDSFPAVQLLLFFDTYHPYVHI